jgi:hypothetical protein
MFPLRLRIFIFIIYSFTFAFRRIGPMSRRCLSTAYARVYMCVCVSMLVCVCVRVV